MARWAPAAGGLRFTPAACGALLVVSLSGVVDHDLWTPDEPRVAAVGREVALGAWVVPTLGGRPFLEQPPLHAWCVALFYRAFGMDPPWRARWISVLLGLAGLAAAGWLAVEIGARRAALPTLVVLGLCGEYVLTAHRVVVDGLLSLCTTLSVCALLRGLRLGSTPGSTGRGLGWFALAHAAASLAFLAKGPIGLLVPALALVAWCLAHRDWRAATRARWWLAPPLFLLIAGPWLLALHRETGPDGLRILLWDNLIGRVVSTEGPRSHERPLYYYLYLLPAHLLPGTLFLAAGVCDRWRRRHTLAPESVRAYDFGLWWFGLGLLILSLANTKRVIYMLPFFPAAALVGGIWLAAFLDGKAAGRLERALPCLLAGLLLLGGTALPLFTLIVPGASWAWAGTGAVVTGLAAVLALRHHRRDAPASAISWCLAALALLVFFACQTAMPPLEKIKGLRSVCERLAELVPGDREILAFGADETTRGMVPLYTGRQLHVLPDLAALRAEIETSGEIYLFVVEKRGRQNEALQNLGAQPREVLLADVREGSRTFKLVRIGR